MNVRAIVKFAKAATSRVLHRSDVSEQRDLLDTLKEEHDALRVLLVQLQRAQAPSERRQLIKQIRATLLPHMKAEEKVVYAALLTLPHPAAQANAYEGYIEHEWAAKTLRRLESVSDASSPEHQAVAKVLAELIDHHLKEEENSLWSDVEQFFSEDTRVEMNTAFLAAKLRVRQH